MRIDKFFTECGALTRSECGKACRAGKITADGIVVRDPSTHIDENNCVVTYNGSVVSYSRFIYIMLNKPEGYVSSTDEPGEKTVFELVPEKYRKGGLFPCGRLDKATLGLIILTNDGQTAHRALAPKSHVPKTYDFTLADDIGEDDIKALQKGVMLADGYKTKPCKIVMRDSRNGTVELSEGKYHQIRRMFASRGNKVVFLMRTSFASIELDTKLAPGQWRLLTGDEEKLLERE